MKTAGNHCPPELTRLGEFDYVWLTRRIVWMRQSTAIEAIIDAEHHRVVPRSNMFMSEQTPINHCDGRTPNHATCQKTGIYALGHLYFDRVHGPVYLGQCLGQFILGVDVLANLGAKINQAIIAGQLWRLITPIFLHASPSNIQVSLLHIGFNMYALFILGPSLERYYGRSRFLLLYFVSGVAGNVVSFYFLPMIR